MSQVVQFRRRSERGDGQENEEDIPMSHGAVFSGQLREVDLGNLDEETGGGTLSSSLLQHLQSIMGDKNVAEVIQLLKDIRTHQDHPDMQQAFYEHDHPIAHAAADHNNDILELLVEDYLRQHNISEEEAEFAAHQHKPGLELHVKHVVMDTLKGYQEVVEGIRGEVGSMAEKLSEDNTISHVRELVGKIHNNRDLPPIRKAIEGLGPGHHSHHVFHGHSDDINHALATAAHKKGYRTVEEASEYVRGELHDELNQHFGESVQYLKAGRGSNSDVFIKNIGIERIQRARMENDRVNAAFSLMEGLQNKLGSDAENVIRKELQLGDDYSTHLLKIIDDEGAEDIEHSFIAQSPSVKLDINSYADKVEDLAALYVRACGQKDYKVRAGFLKMEQAKRLMKEDEKVLNNIPPECSELRELLQSDGDVYESMVNYWLQTDFGNLENMDRLLDKVATDAQSYLDPDLLKNLKIPAKEVASPKEEAANERPEAPSEADEVKERFALMQKIKLAEPGTALHSLSQVMQAAAANYKIYQPLSNAVLESPELHNLIAWFEKEKGGRPEAMVDTYLRHKREAGANAKSFDEFVDSLLLRVQDNCDEGTYKYLLNWNRRETIPVTVPPPSFAGGGEGIPLTTMASISDDAVNDVRVPAQSPTGFEVMPSTPGRAPGIKKEAAPKKLKGDNETPTVPPPRVARERKKEAMREFDVSKLKVKEEPFLYECEKMSVPTGAYTKLAYAMPSSTIEVEDGAALDLFMASDDVTVVLKGDNARVKIEKTTKNCNEIRVVDLNGNPVPESPSVTFGKGVEQKLSA